MTMVEDIIADLTQTSKTLGDPLLKTKVLASRIGNDHLFQWADAELTGYRKENWEVPLYRNGKVAYICTYKRNDRIYENQPFPLSLLNADFLSKFMFYHFTEGVQALEKLAAGDIDNAIGKDFPIDMCRAVTDNLSGPSNIQILKLSMTVQITECTQVLTVIRSRLLDFMLEIEKSFPDLDSIIKGKLTLPEEKKEIFETLVSNIIIHAGDFNSITTGNNNNLQ